jgi:hypothetical protein
MTIEPRGAVAVATKFLQSLYPNVLSDILLEELEISDNERFWLVTLSGLIPLSKEESENAMNPLAQALGGNQLLHRRVYKVFKIDDQTATVKSMKIRQSP